MANFSTGKTRALIFTSVSLYTLAASEKRVWILSIVLSIAQLNCSSIVEYSVSVPPARSYKAHQPVADDFSSLVPETNRQLAFLGLLKIGVTCRKHAAVISLYLVDFEKSYLEFSHQVCSKLFKTVLCL